MKGRVLVLTDHDIYGDQPNGAIHAMRQLLGWLARNWMVEVYSLRRVVAGSGDIRIQVHGQRGFGWRGCVGMIANIMDTVFVRFIRRGFNAVLERWIQALMRRSRARGMFYSERQLRALEQFLVGKTYDAVIVEYINNTYLLRAFVGCKTPRFLDMHDVMHLRSDRFGRAGIAHALQMSKATEYGLLKEYDYLLAIQDEEAEYLRRDFGDRVVTATRPYDVVECALPQPAVDSLVLLFFGSRAVFNLHAYDWFIEHVWAVIGNSGMVLEVAGTLCDVVGAPRASNVRHLGVVARPADAYARCHAVVNPVQIGSGLKIKNIEGMAHGRVVVTTALGSEGMTGAIGRGLVVADNGEEFRRILMMLCERRGEVERLGAMARMFIKERFNAEACFGEFERVLTRAAEGTQGRNGNALEHAELPGCC